MVGRSGPEAIALGITTLLLLLLLRWLKLYGSRVTLSRLRFPGPACKNVYPCPEGHTLKLTLSGSNAPPVPLQDCIAIFVLRSMVHNNMLPDHSAGKNS